MIQVAWTGVCVAAGHAEVLLLKACLKSSCSDKWEKDMENILITILCVTVLFCMIQPSSEAGQLTVGDSKISLDLSIENGVVSETRCNVAANGISDTGRPWLLETDSGVVSPDAGTARLISSDSRSAKFEGNSGGIGWRLSYELTGPGRITKSLSIIPTNSLLIKRVNMWNVRSSYNPVIARTALQDMAAFYRSSDCGLFVSLDFPFSDITRQGDILSVTYPPFIQIKAGQDYACQSLTFGATRLTGRSRYGYDDGEVDAMDAYVQERFEPRFDRPMFVSTPINNRYTQMQGDVIFYTMKDHPTLSFNSDLLKREIKLLNQLGIEYYQVWTGAFDSVPNDPDPNYVKEMVAFGQKNGVKIGDYSGTSDVFCVHYNEYRKTLADYPEWNLNHSDICFGNPRFVDFYISQVVPNCKKYGFDIHCLDFLNIKPCNDSNHHHQPGRESIYAQVLGLTRVLEALNAVSPQMMTWSNSGNWGEFLPKIAWTNHNLYLTDPFIASPWQGLNMTRLLDDARREQMVSLHYSRFIPYRFLTNLQYFFCQNSIVPDIRNFEYGALSTIAVTPNLSLGEIRPWYDTLPADDQQHVKSFYKYWTGLLKRNYSLWKKTYSVGENPGMGSVEIYGHASGKTGFIFIVNPQYWGRTVDVPLNAELGFAGQGEVEIRELYPNQQLFLSAQGPFASLGTSIPIHVEPQQVLVLKVSAAPKKISKPRLYGLPGTVERKGQDYILKTEGLQGRTRRCVVLFPSGGRTVVSAVADENVPKQPKRLWSPTPIKIASSSSKDVTLDVTFRRDAAPDELRNWKAKKADLSKGLTSGWQNGLDDASELRFPLFVDAKDDSIKLPMWSATAGFGPLANFCAAYVENAFQETQQTWINLKTSADGKAQPGEMTSGERLADLREIPVEAKDPSSSWWLQTSFHLPFMYWSGSEPFFDKHTFLVFPFVSKERVRDIKAWINGSPLDVRDYRYPRNRALGCYYADLVGTAAKGGQNNLVVYFEVDQ